MYWARLAVPRPLRKKAGKSEMMASLGTDSIAEARELAGPYVAGWQAWFKALERGDTSVTPQDYVKRAKIAAGVILNGLPSELDVVPSLTTTGILRRAQEAAKEVSEGTLRRFDAVIQVDSAQFAPETAAVCLQSGRAVMALHLDVPSIGMVEGTNEAHRLTARQKRQSSIYWPKVSDLYVYWRKPRIHLSLCPSTYGVTVRWLADDEKMPPRPSSVFGLDTLTGFGEFVDLPVSAFPATMHRNTRPRVLYLDHVLSRHGFRRRVQIEVLAADVVETEGRLTVVLKNRAQDLARPLPVIDITTPAAPVIPLRLPTYPPNATREQRHQIDREAILAASFRNTPILITDALQPEALRPVFY